jgi:hypothetical protein
MKSVKEVGGTLSDKAAMVRDAGLTLFKAFSYQELINLWCQIPTIAEGMRAPVGQRALAERCALYLLDHHVLPPKDMVAAAKEVMKVYAPRRTFNTSTDDKEIEMKNETNVTTPGSNGASVPAAAPTKKAKAAPKPAPRPSAPATPKPALKASKGAVKEPLKGSKAATSGKGAGTVPASAKTGAQGALKKAPSASKAASKPGSPKPRKAASGPRPGTLTEFIVDRTRAGDGVTAIGNAIVKKFADSKAAEEIKGDDFHCIRWYQMQAVKRGWLAVAAVNASQAKKK